MEPNHSVEGVVESETPGVEPVRSHHDVLSLIEEVEQQLARLRTAQSRSAQELAEREARLHEIEIREAAIIETERAFAGRENHLRATAEAIDGERDAIMQEQTRLDAARAELERLRAEHEASECAAATEAERLKGELDQMRAELTRRETVERELAERLADTESSLRNRDEVFERREQESERQREELAQLSREREELRRSLAVAGEKLSRLAQTVAQHAPQLEQGSLASVRVQEQEKSIGELRGRIAQLEAELERGRNEASTGTTMSVEAISRLEESLAEATAAREAAESQIARLEGELESLRSSMESKTKDQGAAEGELAGMRAKLAEFGVFLRLRKDRLSRARLLLRERERWTRAKTREETEAALVRTLEEERLIAKQREDLRHVQEMIAAGEQRLLRRDHRGRTIFAMGWYMLVTAALAAGAWFGSELVMPQKAVAAVDLTAKTRDGGTPAPDQDALFQTIHREALAEQGFRAAVRRRLEDRGLHLLADEKTFASWMEGIRADSDGLGSLRLIATGPDELTAILGLDTVATTLTNESARLGKGRGDVPRITLVGQTNVPGRLTFSTAIPQVNFEDRIIMAGILFLGTLVLGVVIGALILGRLARSKRRFEELEPG